MEHEVTYTFSRTFFMMRYGKNKMRSVDNWKFYLEEYYFIHDDKLMYCDGRNIYEAVGEYALGSPEIMGSWIEVKE